MVELEKIDFNYEDEDKIEINESSKLEINLKIVIH